MKELFKGIGATLLIMALAIGFVAALATSLPVEGDCYNKNLGGLWKIQKSDTGYNYHPPGGELIFMGSFNSDKEAAENPVESTPFRIEELACGDNFVVVSTTGEIITYSPVGSWNSVEVTIRLNGKINTNYRMDRVEVELW